jgi:hypothetical protein
MLQHEHTRMSTAIDSMTSRVFQIEKNVIDDTMISRALNL